MKFYGIWARNFPFVYLLPFYALGFHSTSLILFVPFIAAIILWENKTTRTTKKKCKMKNYFLNFTFFCSQKSCSWKEKNERGEVKWKKIKQRKSFSFFPFSILYWERNENWRRAYFRSLSSLSTQRLLSLYSFTLCCLVKCLDWCFNFIPFI